MRKINILFAFLAIFFTSYSGYSQQNLINNSFENWEEVRNEQNQFLYEEPSGNFWGTLNKLRLLNGPVTTIKSTDAYSGNYSAHLETKSFGTFKIPGLLATGFFNTNEVRFVEGKPFIDSPQKISFFCKYLPQNGDSASIFVCLTKFNPISNKKDTIAEKSLIIREAINTFSKIELDLDYFSNEQPDSLNIVFVSSAGTRGIQSSQNAQIGSIFIIDDINLTYSPNEIKIENTPLKLSYNELENSIIIHNPNILEKLYFRIYDLSSKIIYTEQIAPSYETKIPLNNLQNGIYFIVVSKLNKVLNFLKININK